MCIRDRFIASGMVDENWIKVSITSMTLGIGLYFIPLGMIANQDLIDLQNNPLGREMVVDAFNKLQQGPNGIKASHPWYSKFTKILNGEA